MTDLYDSQGEHTATRALVEEIRQEWVLLSPDGGARWFIGKPLGEGNSEELPSRVMLCPAYAFSVGFDPSARKFLYDVLPILAHGAKLQRFEFQWTMLTYCADMTDGELERLAGLVEQCEGRKEELRIAASGLRRAASLSRVK